MMSSKGEFKGDLEHVAAICGDDVAEELSECLPGVTVYIPSHQEPDGLLLRLSERTREILTRTLPGDTLYVPMRRRTHAETYDAVEKLVARGLSTAEIALRLRISQTHVFRVRAQAGAPKISKAPDPRQLTFKDLL